MEKPMEAKTRIKTHSKPTAWGIGLIALDLILDGGDPKPRLSAGGTCGNVMAILSRDTTKVLGMVPRHGVRMSIPQQHSSAAARKSSNDLTSSKKNSAGQELAEAQTRADRLLMELDQCATRKLRELNYELLLVRNDFNTLK